jgi:uncharacterized protein YprB with RNaseH-like and TPR domain
MLSSTFIHAPGVGSMTEQSLWKQGAVSWTHFLENPSTFKVPASRRFGLIETVSESIENLSQRRVDYFARKLPSRDHWRAIGEFPRIGYLDIETDGGMSASAVTLIGLGDGYDVKIYVKGSDLSAFAYECQDYDGFVTFFGGGFDLPMLQRRFPVLQNVFADRLHIDLCPLLRRLGYRGGLKSIERQLKINRVPETEGLSGLDAVRLWSIYERGGAGADDALRLLLAYNREDVVNMKLLLDFALPRITTDSGWDSYRPKLKLASG